MLDMIDMEISMVTFGEICIVALGILGFLFAAVVLYIIFVLVVEKYL